MRLMRVVKGASLTIAAGMIGFEGSEQYRTHAFLSALRENNYISCKNRDVACVSRAATSTEEFSPAFVNHPYFETYLIYKESEWRGTAYRNPWERLKFSSDDPLARDVAQRRHIELK